MWGGKAALILCLDTHGKLKNKQKKSREKAALIGCLDTHHMCFEELLCFYSLSYLSMLDILGGQVLTN